MIREYEFLQPLVVSLITGRRTRPPYGSSGGEPGREGKNLWLKGDRTVELPPTITIDVRAGDRLTIETPGGGGWGDSDSA